MDAPEDTACSTAADALGPFDLRMGFTRVPGEPLALQVHVDRSWDNAAGATHGGLLMALMDSAMGLAVCARLPDGMVATNVETHNRFLRAAQAGTLVARPHVVREGRRVVVMACTATDAGGREVAMASSTFLVLPRGGPAAP